MSHLLQEEIKEIPSLWWTIEIDDLIRSEKLEEGTEPFVDCMESLFTVLHDHRSALKLAFRCDSLARWLLRACLRPSHAH